MALRKRWGFFSVKLDFMLQCWVCNSVPPRSRKKINFRFCGLAYIRFSIWGDQILGNVSLLYNNKLRLFSTRRLIVFRQEFRPKSFRKTSTPHLVGQSIRALNYPEKGTKPTVAINELLFKILVCVTRMRRNDVKECEKVSISDIEIWICVSWYEPRNPWFNLNRSFYRRGYIPQL